MNADQSDDGTDKYCVVMNETGSYSLLPTGSAMPAGWIPIGPPRTRRECLMWISANWADMYPIGLRCP